MMHNHLVVFVKEPRLGRVKRRLAASIGPIAAWRFYRTTLTRLLRRLGRDSHWTLWLAVTPDRATKARVWQIPGVQPRIISQGHGDLGQRMTKSLRVLPPGPVVIVGSDIPDLDHTHVAKAFRLLGQREFVFGPAMDGGYWLICIRRRPRLPKRLFNGVRWSTRHALTDTWRTLPPGTTIGLLDLLEDVDDAQAFMRWRARTGSAPRGAAHYGLDR